MTQHLIIPSHLWEKFPEPEDKPKLAKAADKRKEVENWLKKKYKGLHINVLENRIYYDKTDCELVELDLRIVKRDLDLAGIKINKNDLADILLCKTFIDFVNPIERYFNQLPQWDGLTDYIKQITGCIELVDESDRPRFEIQFKKMMVRSVACGLGKDVNKHCFTFIGGTHSGKTTFWVQFNPDALFKYRDVNINPVENRLKLALNFMLILDEIKDNIKPEHLKKFKAAMTFDTVKITLPYDRNESVLPRVSNYFGTTNHTDFLEDETGSVRFLCFQVARFKRIENFTKVGYSTTYNKDAAWAQAYTLFKQGDFNYHLTDEEIAENETINKDFYLQDVAKTILKYFYEPANATDGDALFLPPAKILQHIKSNIEIPDELKNDNHLNLTTVGKALKFLDYKNQPKRLDKGYPEHPYILKIKKINNII